jgi:hypothetical protein
VSVAKRKPSTDDKVEAKRKVVRQSLDEITRDVASAMRNANLRSSISIVVPSRHSLVTITSRGNVPPDERERTSAIVREIVAKKLGSPGLRGRALSHAMAKARPTLPTRIHSVPRSLLRVSSSVFCLLRRMAGASSASERSGQMRRSCLTECSASATVGGV